VVYGGGECQCGAPLHERLILLFDVAITFVYGCCHGLGRATREPSHEAVGSSCPVDGDSVWQHGKGRYATLRLTARHIEDNRRYGTCARRASARPQPERCRAHYLARALLDRGLVVFDELKQAAQHIGFLAHPTAGELRVGSTIAIATGFIPSVIDRLSRRYPRLVFHLTAGEAGLTYRSLEERRVDLLVAPMFAPMLQEHMQTDMLYDEPLVVVVGAHSSWARRRKVELAELVNAVWTLPPLDSLYGSVVADAFRAAGLDVPSATVFSSVTPVRHALLASGRFLSMVQASTVRFGTGNPALKVLPVDLPTTLRSIGIITLRNRTLSPVAQLFTDCAHEVAKLVTKRSSS
jgi:DNA-binding transcriptional LysR family regulator